MSQRLAPIIVNAPQRSEDWYNARLGNVTASRVSDTMSYKAVTKPQLAQAMEVYENNGIDTDYIEEMSTKYPWEFCLKVGIDIAESMARKSYRQALVAERITRMRGDTDQYMTEDMKWGVVNEVRAINLYQMKYKKITQTAPLMLHPNLLCGASPDALVIDVETGEIGNAEVKCLRSANHLYKVIREGETPEEYLPQIQMQMWIDNRDWCDFIAFDSRVNDGLNIFVKRNDYDEFYVDNVLEPNIRRFLDECDHDERVFHAIRKRNLETDEI